MPEHARDGSRAVVEVREYGGEASVALAATQLGSKYSDSRKRQIVDEWVEFFESGPTPIRSLHLVTRTPKRLFAALSEQTQLTNLQVKWGDYDDLRVLSAMSELVALRLRGASGVRDLRPLTVLQNVEALQVEGLRGFIDASPVGEMRSVTDLELGGNWMTPRNVCITSAAFLARMPQLQRLLLHTLVVGDLDYRPLLSLPNLKRVRVMGTRGMTPQSRSPSSSCHGKHEETHSSAAERAPTGAAPVGHGSPGDLSSSEERRTAPTRLAAAICP